MYKIFKKNIEGFEKIFENDERLELAKPLFLMKDIECFNRNKTMDTLEYRNLCVIMEKAKVLKEAMKYHGFGMLLNELHLQYFDFENKENDSCRIDQETLDYQVSLLHQFIFPSYYS